MDDFAIEALGLGKRYLLGEDASAHRLARLVMPWLRRKPPPELWALRDVSFGVNAGEAVGIIGRNGAGKSTLLKLLSRITAPTLGSARVRGRVGTLLEVGTGFHPELTGRDNVFLSGTILGMAYDEVKERFDEIVAFAEVERFMDTPVKRYSSGMYVRLAFAVAAFLEPEILIVDEVLAVGDAGFQRKSLSRLNEVSGRDGRTVLFVSHNLEAIRGFCTRALVIDRGSLVFDGPVEDGIAHYLRSIPTRADVRGAALGDRLARTSGAVRFTEVVPLNRAGVDTWRFAMGETVKLRFSYEVHEAVPDLLFHLTMRSTADGHVITVIREKVSSDTIAPGFSGAIELEFPRLPLRPGEISLYAVLSSIDDRHSYDVVDANVDLPLLMITAEGTDKYMRQGIITLDYRFRHHAADNAVTS
jgi:lipopolysaccharide transport system ATP-binding protein